MEVSLLNLDEHSPPVRCVPTKFNGGTSMARQTLVLLFVLTVVLGLGPSFVLSKPDKAKPSSDTPESADTFEPTKDEYYELYKVLVDTLDEIEQNYVKNVDRRELIEAAIHGVLQKLDPYSSYINSDDLNRFRSGVENSFGGIGIQVGFDGGELRVLSPLVGTPAYRAGLMAGDQIIEINGKSTEDLKNIDEAVRRLKGAVGSSVTLTVIHPGSKTPKTVKITREIIHVRTILGDKRKKDDTWDYMLDSDNLIGYLRITAFGRDTAADLRKAIEEIKEQKVRGLILDLRSNPGGLLKSAIEVSDIFIDEGRIVSTSGRSSKKREWNAHTKNSFIDVPMVVLVNRYTASASEIVSACLQDHKRAVIIGERTWGKGSVQNVIELENGRSALKLTTAEYIRPSGKNIHRFPKAKEEDKWGVIPNAGHNAELNDKEMHDWLRYRHNRDILRPHNGSNQLPEGTKSQEYVDRILKMATDYLSSQIAKTRLSDPQPTSVNQSDQAVEPTK